MSDNSHAAASFSPRTRRRLLTNAKHFRCSKCDSYYSTERSLLRIHSTHQHQPERFSIGMNCWIPIERTDTGALATRIRAQNYKRQSPDFINDEAQSSIRKKR